MNLADATAKNLTLTARVIDLDGQALKNFDSPVVIEPGERSADAEWDWPDPVLWSPESPHMLSLALTLLDTNGQVVDELRQPFGFREFWIEGKDFYLNGVKTRLRPAPHGIPLHAGYPQVLEAYVDAYQAMGINFIEMWPGGAFDPKSRAKFEYWKLLAEVAERKGMLISGVVPSMRDYLNGANRLEQYRSAVANYPMFTKLRNHPSVVMWGHSGNVFNSAFQPQNIGRETIERGIMFKSPEQVAHETPVAAELLTVLHELDPTRPAFAHHGAVGGDVHTSNVYFVMTPLQEREQWLSEWAKDGERPFMAVEFGEPLIAPTFHRGRTGFHNGISSEAFPTEYLAAYLGPAAYAGKTEAFRKNLIERFQQDQKYGGWWDPTSYTHADPSQAFLSLFVENVWRSWRTWGLSGGMVAWSIHNTGWQDLENAPKLDLPAFEPGQRGIYKTQLPAAMLHPYEAPGREALAAGQTFVQVNQPTLAWIAGHEPSDDSYGSGFTSKTHNYPAGATVHKQIVLINDTPKTQRYDGKWSVEFDGSSLQSDKISGELAAGDIKFVAVEFNLPPHVKEPTVAGQLQLDVQIGEASHQDRFVFRAFAPVQLASEAPVMVLDPAGETTQMLGDLGIATTPWQSGASPQGLLVVGRHALEGGPAVPREIKQFVQAGGNCIIMAQDPQWMRENLGLRVSWFLSRRGFPLIKDHPALAGLAADDLRDWAGSSTLVEAYPDGRDPDKGVWSRWFPYAGWRWGGQGAITSAAIETPHHGGWTPVIGTEFDLAWSPLLERRFGQGLLTLCMLDLEDHVSVDPAARRLAMQLFDHLRQAEPIPSPGPAVAIGLGRWQATLDDMGLVYEVTDKLPQQPTLVVLGSEANITQSELDAFAQRGGKVLALARDDASPFAGVTFRRDRQFHGSITAPDWPSTRGLSSSDLRWRATGQATLIESGAETAADGLLGRRTLGGGVIVFSQLDPEALDADTRTYLRLTRWRQTRAISQILGNLGAAFATDSALFEGAGQMQKPLTGPWKAKLLVRHEAPETIEERVRENGLSDEARAAVVAGFDDQAWQEVMAPEAWETYGGTWKNADGEAVFRMEIDVPEAWIGYDLEISLGAVHAFDDTFWNGQLVGRTNTETSKWWQHNRKYTVPADQIQAGRNVLAVRIYNDWNDGGFRGRADEMFIRPVGKVGLYHSDYRDDFELGDDPFRYTNW